MANNKKATVAKVIEISASSTKSFEDAIAFGVAKASKSVKNVRAAWVKDQQVEVTNGKVSCYRVNLKVTFEIK